MSDELVLSGKSYLSSKKAAETSGYAQDYIGQLARGGMIDAQRVGGLWYVSMESLNAYKRNAADFKPQPPSNLQGQDPETFVNFDGKDYVSASRAAKLTGYNQDYIGQLARKGAILSRQVGNRWYVDREALLGHKKQKDSMLAAVQSEAVGVQKQEIAHDRYNGSGPYLTYIRENGDLIPTIAKSEEKEQKIGVKALETIEVDEKEPISLPIRREQVSVRVGGSADGVRAYSYSAKPTAIRSALPVKKIAQGVFALTIVILLSYGIISLKDDSRYAFNFGESTSAVSQNDLVAGVYESVMRLGDVLENIIAPEIIYQRN